MRLLYINNGSGLGAAKSGGTARHIEVAKRLMSSRDVSVFVVTTKGAVTLYGNEHFVPTQTIIVRAHLLREKERNHWDRAVSYIISTTHTIFKIPKLPKTEVVYSTSDYFCDVIPSLVYKWYHKARWIIMIHHICKNPFQRKGHFVVNILSYLTQRFSYLLVRFFADRVLVYDTPEGRRIANMIYNNKLLEDKVSFVFNGIEYKKIKSVPKQKKVYDACFAGGLRITKGVYDIIPVWSLVCKKRKDAKLVVAGEGTPCVLRDVRNAIKKINLEGNIVLTGALNSEELFKTMNRSKVFVSMSHEEGWGIAVCEALACGIPIVAYDLPAFEFLKSNINKVPLFDYTSFSKAVIYLLENVEMATSQGIKGNEYVKRYDWEEIAKTEYQIIRSLC